MKCLLRKETELNSLQRIRKVNKTVIMAMLSAIAVILMYFDFPIPIIAPGFYKIDFSEVPVLIGSFMLGPCAGVVIEAVKVILHFCMKELQQHLLAILLTSYLAVCMLCRLL